MADGLSLHYDMVEWYKVNFFPNSKYGAEMLLKDFTVESCSDTPVATPKQTMTPYPTLEPTPTPTPAASGAPTPKPTLNPMPAPNAASKNVYTYHEDFELYANDIGSEPQNNRFDKFDVTLKTEKDEYNNKFVTLTNSATGLRYIATSNDVTTLIGTKAVTQMKLRFNKLAANDNGTVAMIDLTSSSAHNSKSDDTRLVIAQRINIDTSGAVTVGDTTLGTVTTGKWYTLKSVSDVASKKNSIYLYDENGLTGSITDSDFYNFEANGIKNIRFNMKRGSGSMSLDDIYMYELKDDSETVFDDVTEFDAPMLNYLATLGIAKKSGIKITAVYESSGALKDVFFGEDNVTYNEDETVKHFIWDSFSGMKPVQSVGFLGGDVISASEINEIILTATESRPVRQYHKRKTVYKHGKCILHTFRR